MAVSLVRLGDNAICILRFISERHNVHRPDREAKNINPWRHPGRPEAEPGPNGSSACRNLGEWGPGSMAGATKCGDRGDGNAKTGRRDQNSSS